MGLWGLYSNFIIGLNEIVRRVHMYYDDDGVYHNTENKTLSIPNEY